MQRWFTGREENMSHASVVAGNKEQSGLKNRKWRNKRNFFTKEVSLPKKVFLYHIYFPLW